MADAIFTKPIAQTQSRSSSQTENQSVDLFNPEAHDMDKRRHHVTAGSVLMAALFAAPAVHALPSGVYLGAGLGVAHATDLGNGAINQALASQGLNVRTVSVDDTSDVWKVFAGYRFNPNLAVEAGYTSLGSYDFQGQVIADPGTVQAGFDAWAWNVAALAIFPTAPGPELFCKAGMGYWQAKLDGTGTFSGASVRAVESHGVSPLVGLGAAYHLSPTWTVRVEGERYFNVGKASGSGRTNIDLLFLGLQYHF